MVTSQLTTNPILILIKHPKYRIAGTCTGTGTGTGTGRIGTNLQGFYRIFPSLALLVFMFSSLNAIAQEVYYVTGSTVKIEQLVGDWDNQRDMPTENLTNSQYGINATDLGVPFRHKGKTYVAFGDIPPPGYDRDPLGYTTDTIPEDGISLDFIANDNGSHRPVDIPGVSLKGFEVPMEGVSWNDIMYLYATTDVMTRSVLAKSTDDGYNFTKLYDVSSSKFVNISLVKTESDEDYPDPVGTDIQIMTGSGTYRESSVYLAYQRADQIESKSMKFFSGIEEDNSPIWSDKESDGAPVFSQPCVGELSLSYNKFIKKWLLLYNCGTPRGINCSVADKPWGPWSEPFVIFDPAVDNGYCYFMHSNWEVNQCDNVQDPGRENEWGGEYGPYQFEDLAIGSDTETTIYYTMSTWNPYTVVLMKSTLRTDDYVVTGITERNNGELRIYPNPASNEISLNFKPADGSGSIAIISVTGQAVMKKKIDMSTGKVNLSLSDEKMPAGMYLLQFYNPNTDAPVNRTIIKL